MSDYEDDMCDSAFEPPRDRSGERARRLETARRFREKLGAPEAFRAHGEPDATEFDVRERYVPVGLLGSVELSVSHDGNSIELRAHVLEPETLNYILLALRRERPQT